jgi:hypothetical protein
MVTTLMIERMPLSATDKQTGRAVHLVIALCQGHSLSTSNGRSPQLRLARLLLL